MIKISICFIVKEAGQAGTTSPRSKWAREEKAERERGEERAIKASGEKEQAILREKREQ